MGRLRLKCVEIEPGPVLDALELLQVYGVPLGRVIDHPEFRLAMRGVILSEGGDPDEWLGLQLAPKTRLMLVGIELESIWHDLQKAGAPTLELHQAREHVELALKSLGE